MTRSRKRNYPTLATPKDQQYFDVSGQPNPPHTPHKSTTRAASADQTEVRVNLGYFNNEDMFLQETEQFLKDYAPCEVSSGQVEECVNRLCNREKPLIKRTAGGSYQWTCFPSSFGKATGKKGHEDVIFRPLAPLIKAIFEQKDDANNLEFQLCPRTKIDGDIKGGNHLVDGCFFDESYAGTSIPHRVIKTPVELKKKRSAKDRKKVNQQILGACHHILNEDPRRMWIYGITIEQKWISFWFFSRSHSVKTYAFDWFKDPKLFIHAMLSFAYATPAQLGVDPLVHKGPVAGDGKSLSYVYEVPGVGAGGSPVFYKTGPSLVPERLMCISGRVTRVWEVTEVRSADGNDEVDPNKKFILKDVWLDEGSATEAENLDKIFKAIDELVAAGSNAQIQDELQTDAGLDREPATMDRLTMQFISNEPRFKAFDDATKARLVHYFTDKNYRSLFLTKLHAWKGMVSKSLGSKVRHYPLLFPGPAYTRKQESVDSDSDSESDDESGNLGPSSMQTQIKTGASYREGVNDATVASLAEKLEGSLGTGKRPRFARHFLAKQQSRFVYEEVCTPVHRLSTLGDAVDVLFQATDALKILYSVGWVHRDISVGNILAFPPQDKSSGWSVKLSDLEFSRLMIDENRQVRTDPRTGTPFFMPTEILSRAYLFEDYRGPPTTSDVCDLAEHLNKNNDPDFAPLRNFIELPFNRKAVPIPPNYDFEKIPSSSAVVNHNYQHDLESVWWILVWLITMCITNHSTTDCRPLFQHDVNNFRHRSNFFEKSVTLKLADIATPLCEKFPTWMERLRREMHKAYIIRPIFGQLNLPEAYSDIHATFSSIFQEMHLHKGDWRKLKLRRSRIGLMKFPLLQTKPVGTKRGHSDDASPSSMPGPSKKSRY